jgi:hypothetical protein
MNLTKYQACNAFGQICVNRHWRMVQELHDFLDPMNSQEENNKIAMGQRRDA